MKKNLAKSVRISQIFSYFSFAKLEKWVIGSWWVIAFTLLCYLAYEHGLRKRDRDFSRLKEHYSELQLEKLSAEAHKEHLLLQVNSQGDPDWVELTLMKGLGLVPEGQIKVLFAIPASSQNEKF